MYILGYVIKSSSDICEIASKKGDAPWASQNDDPAANKKREWLYKELQSLISWGQLLETMSWW